jgi:lantibiotic leader peptide-processing serine protease
MKRSFFMKIKSVLTGALGLGMICAAVSANAQTYILSANGNGFDKKMTQKIEAAGGVINKVLPQIGIAIVEADDNFAEAAAKVKGVNLVVADVELNFVDEGAAEYQVSENDLSEQISGDGNYPSDSFGFLLWNMDAINAPDAHALGFTGNGVRVAVLDSGVDSSHADLVVNLNSTLSTSFVDGEDYDNPPGGHGTHVSGTILAAANGFGVVGVAPDAELVSVKVLSAVTGSGSFAGIIQGIVYAADVDADVINMSLGIPNGVARNTKGFSALATMTQKAINYAYQSGVTVVASAGNDARDMDHDASVISFPGGLANVLTVSSTAPVGWALNTATDLDNLASYSNYGQSSIDFAGPGGDSSYLGNEICIFGIPCWVFDMQLSTVPGGSYSWSAGTSMASPHVAGVAALIIGANGGDMSPAQVKAKLKQSSLDLGKPGRDDVFGHGRVDALRAVQ